MSWGGIRNCVISSPRDTAVSPFLNFFPEIHIYLPSGGLPLSPPAPLCFLSPLCMTSGSHEQNLGGARFPSLPLPPPFPSRKQKHSRGVEKRHNICSILAQWQGVSEAPVGAASSLSQNDNAVVEFSPAAKGGGRGGKWVFPRVAQWGTPQEICTTSVVYPAAPTCHRSVVSLTGPARPSGMAELGFALVPLRSQFQHSKATLALGCPLSTTGLLAVN